MIGDGRWKIMAPRRKAAKAVKTNKLDSKPYIDKTRKAGEMARQAMARYGQPAISLPELRKRLSEEVRGSSLLELINRDHESGW